GRCSFPENHPLFLGVTGSYGPSVTNEIVRESDLAFFIGNRADPHSTDGGTAPEPGKSKVIQLDIDPVVLNRNYHADVALIGDARESLRKLVGAIKNLVRKRRGGR